MKNRSVVLRIVLDVIMLAFLASLYSKNVISLAYHEAAGLALLVLVVLHTLLNRRWLSAVARAFSVQMKNGRSRVVIIVTALLTLSWLGVFVTGVLVSKRLFSFGMSRLNPWHFFCAAVAIIFTGAHLGLYWNYFWGFAGRHIRLPRFLAVMLMIAVVCFGGYRLASSGFRRWISAPFVASQMHHHRPAHGEGHGAPGQTNARPGHGGGQGRGMKQPFSWLRLADVCASSFSMVFFFAALTHALDELYKKRALKTLAASRGPDKNA